MDEIRRSQAAKDPTGRGRINQRLLKKGGETVITIFPSKAGAAAGAAAGIAIGKMVPGISIITGGAVGAIIGGIVGYIFGPSE